MPSLLASLSAAAGLSLVVFATHVRRSLPCEQVPVTIGTTTTNLDMCLERFSEPLSYLRFAILLAATALAALIILG